MSSESIKVFELYGRNPQEWGQSHGEAFREQIAELAEIRMERMCFVSTFKSKKSVIELAEQYLPILKRFDQNLFEEFQGIAQASNLSLPLLMVLNNYTDMRDLGQPIGDGGCSIIFSPSANGPLLGQTWDIHGTALPYVLLLKYQDLLIFTITGCLGMTGMNSSGVALAINNLLSTDATVGVMWPAAIRKALRCKSALAATEEIMNIYTGSGRHYAVADMENFFGIETSGSKKKIIEEDNNNLYFHTNHCIDPEMFKTHKIGKDSTTIERFRYLDENTRNQDLSSPSKVFLALAGVSMSLNKEHPQNIATCGTIVMDIANRLMLACPGTASEEKLSCPSATNQLEAT